MRDKKHFILAAIMFLVCYCTAALLISSVLTERNPGFTLTFLGILLFPALVVMLITIIIGIARYSIMLFSIIINIIKSSRYKNGH